MGQSDQGVERPAMSALGHAFTLKADIPCGSRMPALCQQQTRRHSFDRLVGAGEERQPISGRDIFD